VTSPTMMTTRKHSWSLVVQQDASRFTSFCDFMM
jgi:hypothetical protein